MSLGLWPDLVGGHSGWEGEDSVNPSDLHVCTEACPPAAHQHRPPWEPQGPAQGRRACRPPGELPAGEPVALPDGTRDGERAVLDALWSATDGRGDPPPRHVDRGALDVTTWRQTHATSATFGEACMTLNGLHQGFKTDGPGTRCRLTPASRPGNRHSRESQSSLVRCPTRRGRGWHATMKQLRGLSPQSRAGGRRCCHRIPTGLQ